MFEAARTLAQNIPFVRVDFYALPKLVFDEMTLYPESGIGPFNPPEYDLLLGSMIKLPPVQSKLQSVRWYQLVIRAKTPLIQADFKNARNCGIRATQTRGTSIRNP